jgi:hypothetical protein
VRSAGSSAPVPVKHRAVNASSLLKNTPYKYKPYTSHHQCTCLSTPNACAQLNCYNYKYYNLQNIVTDLLKEFLSSASVNTAIMQQYKTLRFSACQPLTSHLYSKQGSRDSASRSDVTPATRDVSNSGESCFSARADHRGYLEVTSDAKSSSRYFEFKLVLGARQPREVRT